MADIEPTVVAAPQAPQTAETTTATTAAKKKGGYHYWHSFGKERALVGDVAPPPVHQKVEGAPIEFDAVASLKKAVISSYSWCDNTKTVSVYVDFKGVGSIEAEKINVKFAEKSLRLSIEHEGKDNVLTLHLSKTIDPEKSSFKLKPDQLVFRLVKSSEEAWFDLTGAAAVGDEDE